MEIPNDDDDDCIVSSLNSEIELELKHNTTYI